MPTDGTKKCIYECNKDAECKSPSCDECPLKPGRVEGKRGFYASGKALVKGSWQSCCWPIEASSFAEAAAIAEADPTFQLHELSDNAMR